MTSKRPDIVRSFGRCIAQSAFMDRFYEIFLESHPEVQPLFAETDFGSQKKLLRQGLNMLLMYAGGADEAKHALDRLQISHGRGQRNIDPTLYPFWVDSLIQALSEFDHQWSPALAQAWRDAMQRGVDHMVQGY